MPVSPRAVSALVGGFLLVAVFVLFWVLWPSRASSGPPDDRAITMPSTFMELDVSPYNTGDDPESVATLREDVGGAQLAFAMYGKAGGTTVSVTATRTDLTGRVDLRMLNDNGQRYSNSYCSSNLSLRTADQGPDGEGSPYPGGLICWRTSDRLSVSAFALIKPPAEEELARAVDLFWESLR
ncbi:hypothetical protein LWF15_30050 [Kineosporia rhizophila]|uniref:hypothetical protein n=1 Tax=Kineosporia TaxID=49184 RepID=UPI001E2D1DA6|nr:MULTISPECIES: hypothetical protein [Kineosporia]MCE0539751.1 hypothetical protein [Kineosporia rhizophila]GLY16353.1 hypothetical protein Kisp01_33680 [Kineosporia sp. NBRC 101677]